MLGRKKWQYHPTVFQSLGEKVPIFSQSFFDTKYQALLHRKQYKGWCLPVPVWHGAYRYCSLLPAARRRRPIPLYNSHPQGRRRCWSSNPHAQINSSAKCHKAQNQLKSHQNIRKSRRTKGKSRKLPGKQCPKS